MTKTLWNSDSLVIKTPWEEFFCCLLRKAVCYKSAMMDHQSSEDLANFEPLKSPQNTSPSFGTCDTEEPLVPPFPIPKSHQKITPEEPQLLTCSNYCDSLHIVYNITESFQPEPSFPPHLPVRWLEKQKNTKELVLRFSKEITVKDALQGSKSTAYQSKSS